MSSPFERYQTRGLQHGAKPPEPLLPAQDASFLEELTKLVNKHSKENGSGTPDFILADYLVKCLDIFNQTLSNRAEWRGERLDAPFNLKYGKKIKIAVYDVHGRRNEIGEAEITVWPGETTRYGPIAGLIPIFENIPPSGFTEPQQDDEAK